MKIDTDLKQICSSICAAHKSLEEWRMIESCDYFQQGKYVGGFDATEDAFCFSYYHEDGHEYWFQISLSEVEEIVNEKKTQISLREAE
jgi:hypothetical protein